MTGTKGLCNCRRLTWPLLLALLLGLLGQGAPVPMLVIFLGVIGGFILSGFIGLFTGAIVISLGYKLFVAWLD